MVDIFYYSRHCEHSQTVIQYITKNNIIEKVSSICIDNRIKENNNSQIMVLLDNGQKIALPPTIMTVPAILCVSKNYTVVLGTKNIIDYFESDKQYINVQQTQSKVLKTNVEPISYDYNNSNTFITSDKFTNYNSTHKQIYNYTTVDETQYANGIKTPKEDYESDKISNSDMDKMLEQRNKDLPLPITNL